MTKAKTAKEYPRLRSWLKATAPSPLLVSCTHGDPLNEMTLGVQKIADECIVVDILPEEKSITIDQVRDMLSSVAQTSWHGQRVVIIAQAQRITREASNALLKILEQPPSTTRFILTTRWPQRLLPTIRSRCQHLRLPAQIQAAIRENHTQQNLLELLGLYAKKSELDEEQLQLIFQLLNQHLRAKGATAQLKTAYQRLRDYYVIAEKPGGTKLAKDVLLASMPTRG